MTVVLYPTPSFVWPLLGKGTGLIKEGSRPEDWNEGTRRKKDTDARWPKKNGKSYYGYKNHISGIPAAAYDR